MCADLPVRERAEVGTAPRCKWSAEDSTVSLPYFLENMQISILMSWDILLLGVLT